MLTVGGATLGTRAGVPAWLASREGSGWVTAVLPTDHVTSIRLQTPAGVVECAALACGRIRVHTEDPVVLLLDTLALQAPLYFTDREGIKRVLVLDREIGQSGSSVIAGSWKPSLEKPIDSRFTGVG